MKSGESVVPAFFALQCYSLTPRDITRKYNDSAVLRSLDVGVMGKLLGASLPPSHKLAACKRPVFPLEG